MLQASPGTGICFHINNLVITDCRVRLEVQQKVPNTEKDKYTLVVSKVIIYLYDKKFKFALVLSNFW